MNKQCRSCNSERLREVIDLGDQHISEFRKDERQPPKFPLAMVVCEDCTLAQLSNTAPPEKLYNSSYSFKSGVNEAIVKDLAMVAAHAHSVKPDAKRWLDIASNDGSLLANVPEQIYRVGIDPLKQFEKEASQHADRIIVDFFNPRHFVGEKPFDVITSVSMFYDLDNPNVFVGGVASVLADDGVWVIQQNYLRTMLESKAVDNLSHEHLTYYSLTSLVPLLARHGLEVVDVELNPINGGCFRTVVRKKGVAEVQRSVAEMLTAEALAGLGVNGDYRSFDTFVSESMRTLANLRVAVETIVEAGHRIFIYGASTRGAVIWQAAGIDRDLVPFAVERNPDKVGRYFSAIGVPIISEDKARVEQPEYMLIGPWWFADEFAKREEAYLKRGGVFIVPLPELRFIRGEK